MNGEPKIDPLEPLSRGALRHHIVQSLLKAIIHGDLAPGTRLVTNTLATRLGVSATPIREALVELEQSGVVELMHHRGALVKPFGRAELRDFYALRRLLECEAVRLVCGQVDREILGALRNELERLLQESGGIREQWLNDVRAVDHRIHLLPIEHCSNKRLVAEIQRHSIVGETIRDIIVGEIMRDRQKNNPALHCDCISPLVDFLDAMQQHRADAAVAAMEQHISRVAAMVEAVMFDSKQD